MVIARGVGQVARQQLLVDAQIGRDARHVRGLGAPGARELADPVDGVVVVEGEQEAVAGVERVRLADEPQRAGGVRGEDRDVLVGRGVEELEHGRAGALDELGARRRGRVDGVRVAEHAALEQPHVLAQLRLGVEPAAGVVEVHVAAAVKAREVAAAQLVQHGRLLRRRDGRGETRSRARCAVTERGSCRGRWKGQVGRAGDRGGDEDQVDAGNARPAAGRVGRQIGGVAVEQLAYRAGDGGVGMVGG